MICALNIVLKTSKFITISNEAFEIIKQSCFSTPYLDL